MNDNQVNGISRRSLLRTTGIALATGVAASTPAMAASTERQTTADPQSAAQQSGDDDVTIQLREGQRVRATIDEISVWTGIYNDDTYLGKATGGPNSRAHGTTLSEPLYSPDYEQDMIEVAWDYTGLQGWSVTSNMAPVTCPTC